MKLRNKPTFIRVGKEGKAPKKINFDKFPLNKFLKSLNLTNNLSRFIYFLVLAIIGLAIVKMIYQRMSFVKGVGLIQFNTIDVRAEEDMKIDYVYIKEGMFVDKNRKLFAATLIGGKTNGTTSRGISNNSILGLKQKMLNIEKEIVLNEIELKNIFRKHQQYENERVEIEDFITKDFGYSARLGSSGINFLRKKVPDIYKEIRLKEEKLRYLKNERSRFNDQAKKLQELVTLEVLSQEKFEAVKKDVENKRIEIEALENEIMIFRKYKLEMVFTEHLEPLKNKIEDLKFGRKRIKTEIALLKNYQSELAHEMKLNQVFIVEQGKILEVEDTSGTNKTVYSPVNSQVVKVITHDNEIALKGEQVLKLATLENMKIRGFFDQDKLDYVKVGQIVDIDFPDGVTRKGMISKFYYSTMALPVEFQRKYEPTRRNLVADIIPIEGEEKTWMMFHKLSVVIRINRLEQFLWH